MQMLDVVRFKQRHTASRHTFIEAKRVSVGLGLRNGFGDSCCSVRKPVKSEDTCNCPNRIAPKRVIGCPMHGKQLVAIGPPPRCIKLNVPLGLMIDEKV